MSFGAPFWHDYLKTFVNIRKTIAGKAGQSASTPGPSTASADTKVEVQSEPSTTVKPEATVPNSGVGAGTWLP